MSVLCAHCGQPIADVAANPAYDGFPLRDIIEPRYYHGACWNLEHPPEHPDQPRRIAAYSHDERVADGLDKP